MKQKERVDMKSKLKDNKAFSHLSLLLILVVICIIITILRPSFLSYKNIFNLLRSMSVTGFIAIGMTFVIITGGIELSVGSVVGFSSVMCGVLMKNQGWGIFPSLLVITILCLLIGLLNGILIHYGKLPEFIATLGTMQMLRGLAMVITNGRLISGIPSEFTSFAQLNILGLPSLFIVWLIVILIAAYLLKYSIYGRGIYAIGSNKEASRLSGIKVGPTICSTYMLNAFCACMAGILLTARVTSAQPAAGEGYEMEAIAAAVIGGASLSGAEGSIVGTVIGAIIMAVLTNGGNLLGVNSFIIDIVIGGLIVVAVLIEKNKK